MNGIVEIILEMLSEDITFNEETFSRNLCYSIKSWSCYGISCYNCPLSVSAANKNMKKLYGDEND